MTHTRSTRGHHDAVIHERIAALAAGGGARASRRSPRVSSDQAPPVNVPGIDKPVIVVTGEVTGNETWINTNYYVLRGAVFVRDGATLNIQAGHAHHRRVRQRRHADRRARRPAERHRHARAADRLHQRPAGRQRARAATGAASSSTAARRSTFAGGEGAGEGDTGVYGGTEPNDNSGTLRYVRVEFAGVEFSPDNELNGIAFQGVGRGGSVRYIQVAHEPRRRDGVVRRHGRHQVRRGVQRRRRQLRLDVRLDRPRAVRRRHQRGDDADNGIEADNNEFNNNVLPRVEPADLQHHDVRRPGPQRGRREHRARTCSAAARRSRSATS